MTTVLTAPPTASQQQATLAAKVFAFGVAIAVGFRVDLFKGVSPGVLLMVVLAPLWWPQLRASRPVQWLVGLTVLALLSGTVLAWLVKNQRDVDFRVATSFASVAALACAGVVVLLWARTLISTSATIVGYLVGFLLYTVETPSTYNGNPWKFALALPVTVLALIGVAWLAKRAGRPRPVLTVLVFAFFIGMGVTFDYRSEAGFLALGALITVWQAVAIGNRRRLKVASPVLLIGSLAVVVYLLATQLFVSGVFGAEIQQRSAAQIDASGSLLLGGRPEWSATWQLMQEHPKGYGLGVLATSHDVQLAENGFNSINADPATGFEAYITNYMMSGGIHLHSVAADLWVTCGIPGLLLALAVLVVVAWSLSASLAVGRAEPLLIYISIPVMWNIGFSPLYSSMTGLLLGLFVAVVSFEFARGVRADRSSDPAPAEGRTDASPVVPGRLLYGAAAAPPDPNGGRRGLL